MSDIQIHKAPKGKSIRAQLSKVSSTRGIIVYTYWWNNTVTRMDGFGGQTRKWVFSSLEEQRDSYRKLESQGYSRV